MSRTQLKHFIDFCAPLFGKGNNLTLQKLRRLSETNFTGIFTLETFVKAMLDMHTQTYGQHMPEPEKTKQRSGSKDREYRNEITKKFEAVL